MSHDRKPDDHDRDLATYVTIAVFLGLLSFGTCFNIISGHEVFSGIALVAFLTATVGLLLGVNPWRS